MIKNQKSAHNCLFHKSLPLSDQFQDYQRLIRIPKILWLIQPFFQHFSHNGHLPLKAQNKWHWSVLRYSFVRWHHDVSVFHQSYGRQRHFGMLLRYRNEVITVRFHCNASEQIKLLACNSWKSYVSAKPPFSDFWVPADIPVRILIDVSSRLSLPVREVEPQSRSLRKITSNRLAQGVN